MVGQETECAESVVYGYDDYSFFGQILAVEFHFSGITPLESAAVDPDENGKLIVLALGISPNVQIETVFLAVDVGIDMPFPAVNVSADTGLILIRNGSELICIVNAVPILCGKGCFPAVFPYGRLGKRDSFENRYTGIVSGKASYKSVLGLYDS